jgi:hypothetical protein
MTIYIILGKNFIITLDKLDVCHSIQVSSLEKEKISKFWESCHNFHLAHQILVIPMELQRKHIRVLQK